MLGMKEGTFTLTYEEPSSSESAFSFSLKRLLFMAMKSLDDDNHDSLSTQRF